MKGDDIAERLVGLAVCSLKLVDALPTSAAGRHITLQLVRSLTSAGANYEEARAAESKRDFTHKLGIALKELQESRYWLRVIAGAEMASGSQLGELAREVDELCRIIGRSKVTAGSRMENEPR